MKTKIQLYVFILSLFTFSSQAVLSQNHAAERFAAVNLKTNGVFDVAKIDQFIERLKKEKMALASDMYETKIMEKIELETESHKDALKSAKKELDSTKSKYLMAYELFLIPQIELLKACVEQNPAQSVSSSLSCEGIVNRFINGYSAFYLPEAPRNIFNQDLDYPFIAKNLLGYKFKRNTKKVEANNLLVETENFVVTKACLQDVRNDQILTQSQIAKLKSCGVDISIYNPADDTLWKKHTAESFSEAKNRHEDWFPNSNETIYFKKVKYSSAGSPKLEAEFERNGKEIDVKIKMGFETHTEITTSILGKMLGMYQDTSVHRKLVKIYFKGGADYESFKAQWERKYSGINKEHATYVKSYGADQNGKYVVLQDVQLSINDPDFLRVGPYDPAGWDLPNRREHRAQVLWYGLVNMIDAKTGNHEVLFEKTSSGLLPRFSFQDVGYSLHFQINLLRPLEMLRSVLSWGVNTYAPTFLDWDEDSVHIQWSDVMFNRSRFGTTTYADLKWMARQIAKLSHEDIKYAVRSANFPPDVEDLYIHKITARRNEVVKAFALTDEFSLYFVPNLEHYSPNNNVKDGKIVVSQFAGYTNYELPRNTVLPVILQVAASFVKLEALEKKLQAKVADDISVNYQNSDLGKELPVKDISAGVGLELSRSVNINNQYVVRDGKTQAFVVKDRFAIEINVGSSLYTTLKKVFPDQLSVNANIKVWRREFEFVHFADTWHEGYTSKVKLFSYVSDWKKCVIECLERGEVLKISDSYGISGGARVPIGAIAGLPMSMGTSVFWQTSKPVYFSRDQFNQLIVYEAENTTWGHSQSIGIDKSLDLFILNLPFLGFNQSTEYVNHEAVLYRFSAPRNIENFNVVEQIRSKQERNLLSRYLESGDKDPLVLSKKDLDIKASGKFKTSSLSFLFLFKNETAKGASKAVVKTSRKETRNFQRYSGEQTSLFGADKRILIIDKEATVVYKDTTKISIEMDEADKNNIIAYVEVWNFERKLNRKGLVDYIDDLNKFFSQNSSLPFYRDYYLPPKQQMNTYRKVYGHTRIYFYGDTLVNALRSLSKAQLTELYAKTYKGERASCNGGKTNVTCPYALNLRTFLNAVSELKQHIIKDAKYLRLYYDVLEAIKIRENGIQLVSSVISDKDMFVMGEIYGVFPSFSAMQQDEQHAGRRFAAKSWGNYQIPPLRKFLSQNSLTQESIYINGEINFDDIFGPLPSGRVEYY